LTSTPNLAASINNENKPSLARKPSFNGAGARPSIGTALKSNEADNILANKFKKYYIEMTKKEVNINLHLFIYFIFLSKYFRIKFTI
jgi:hypothetical protein